MKKYYIPRELLKELMERPIRSCYEEGRMLQYTSRDGERVYVLAAEEEKSNENIESKSTTARPERSGEQSTNH